MSTVKRPLNAPQRAGGDRRTVRSLLWPDATVEEIEQARKLAQVCFEADATLELRGCRWPTSRRDGTRSASSSAYRRSTVMRMACPK